MHLNPGRLQDLVESNVSADSALTCHETTGTRAALPAVCRGFFDAYKARTLPLRLAEGMNVIEFDPAPRKEPAVPKKLTTNPSHPPMTERFDRD